MRAASVSANFRVSIFKNSDKVDIDRQEHDIAFLELSERTLESFS
jgi:hypothetical protein